VRNDSERHDRTPHQEEGDATMDTSYDALDRETLKTEIRAAIAAAREVDPSMDEHLAHSAMTRYFADRPRPPQVPEPRDEPLTVDGIILRGASLLLGGGVIIALIASHAWTMYWLIIPIMLMFLAIFSRDKRNRERHDERHAYKQHMREEQRRYQDAHLSYKAEMLAAKRAILHGIIKGFSNSQRDR